MTEFYEQVKERLMRYARINTESDPHSTSVPTTSCQHDLASVIYEELQNAAKQLSGWEHEQLQGTEREISDSWEP